MVLKVKGKVIKMSKKFTKAVKVISAILAIATILILGACGQENNSQDLTQMTIKISKPTGGQNDTNVAPLIDPGVYPQVAVLITITAPDLSAPLQFFFSPQEVAQNMGVLTVLVPSGASRTVDVEVYEIYTGTKVMGNEFPGMVWVTNTPASARTVNLTGTPTVMNISVVPATTTSINGIIRDSRTGAMQPLQGCANPDVTMAFSLVSPPLAVGSVPITVTPDTGDYILVNVPETKEIIITALDSTTGANTTLRRTPGTNTLDFDLIGAMPLTISPTDVTVPPGGNVQFVATGGTGPGTYTFEFEFTPGSDPGASINSATGYYTAGSTGNSQDFIMVTDNCGQSAHAIVTVSTNPACSDGMDNDGDYAVDYPDDPGCTSPSDTSERGTVECDDGIDNDGDTHIDYPNDEDCSSPAGTSESGTGLGSISGHVVNPMGNPIIGASIIVEDTMAPNTVTYSGNTNSLGDFTILNLPTGDYYLRISFTGFREEYYNSHVYSDRSFANSVTVLAPSDFNVGTITLTYTMCNDGIDSDGWGEPDGSDPGCSSIDDSSEQGADVCDNGLDDDGDTFVDVEDGGCAVPADTTEYSASIQQCDNGFDDDMDGFIDSEDPSCIRGGTMERSPDINLACDDGTDNDSDAYADYPNDSECITPFTYSEYFPMEDCDGVYDVDGDGYFGGSDPGCLASGNSSEKDVSLPCDDGIDNDGDGYYDYNPMSTTGDPGCDDPNDASETAIYPMFPCDDGIDNDGDGLIDFPDDPGCQSIQDSDEISPSPGMMPCDNGIDDDGDGYTDFQCNYGYDLAPGVAGVDDDGDTIVDNSRECGFFGSDDYLGGDPGCVSSWDPFETQPGFECDDGIDNDGDTLVDLADSLCYSQPMCDDELMGLGPFCFAP